MDGPRFSATTAQVSQTPRRADGLSNSNEVLRALRGKSSPKLPPSHTHALACALTVPAAGPGSGPPAHRSARGGCGRGRCVDGIGGEEEVGALCEDRGGEEGDAMCVRIGEGRGRYVVEDRGWKEGGRFVSEEKNIGNRARMEGRGTGQEGRDGKTGKQMGREGGGEGSLFTMQAPPYGRCRKPERPAVFSGQRACWARL
eukprot:364784-Chlamydomonas_euryale.AAC.15